MIFLKRQVPLIIAFVMGVVFAAQYYVPHPLSEKLFTEVNDWQIVIGVFAMFLGIISLGHFHISKIRKKAEGWGFSAIVLLAIAIVVAAGVYSHGKDMDEQSGLLTPLGWSYQNMLVPLQGTMFSILAFFVASAAFRAFRAKTLEASLLLCAAIIVMFGRVPLGEYLWTLIPFGHEASTEGSFSIGNIVDWIMNTPNLASRRGIWIGVALGAVATSLKIILGIERTYLGGGRD